MSYEGPISRKAMKGVVLKAYHSWEAQVGRCRRKTSRGYRWWGMKGVEVRYSPREFINWYLEELEKNNFTDPVVSRIDHDGHYEFGNIRLEERSSNSSEARQRNRHKVAREIHVFDKSKRETFIVTGSIEAERLTGINRGTINRYLNKKQRPKESCRFSFAFGGELCVA